MFPVSQRPPETRLRQLRVIANDIWRLCSCWPRPVSGQQFRSKQGADCYLCVSHLFSREYQNQVAVRVPETWQTVILSLRNYRWRRGWYPGRSPYTYSVGPATMLWSNLSTIPVAAIDQNRSSSPRGARAQTKENWGLCSFRTGAGAQQGTGMARSLGNSSSNNKVACRFNRF